jgi:hypothetical protein
MLYVRTYREIPEDDRSVEEVRCITLVSLAPAVKTLALYDSGVASSESSHRDI